MAEPYYLRFTPEMYYRVIVQVPQGPRGRNTFDVAQWLRQNYQAQMCHRPGADLPSIQHSDGSLRRPTGLHLEFEDQQRALEFVLKYG